MIEYRQPFEVEIPQIEELRFLVLDQPSGQPKQLWSVEDSDPQTIHAVAVKDDQVISSLRIEDNPNYGPYVRRMATLPACRYRGVGRGVLALAETLAKLRGVHSLKLHSRGNVIGFYEKCGYMLTGQSNQDGAGIYPEMMKEL